MRQRLLHINTKLAPWRLSSLGAQTWSMWNNRAQPQYANLSWSFGFRAVAWTNKISSGQHRHCMLVAGGEPVIEIIWFCFESGCCAPTSSWAGAVGVKLVPPRLAITSVTCERTNPNGMCETRQSNPCRPVDTRPF